MRFNRVLLVSPDNSEAAPEHPQLGFGYLSEALDAQGIENRVVDLRLGGGWQALENGVREFRPDLVGFSMKTLLYRRTYRLIEDLKRAFPKVAMIAGGPHVSTFREQVLRECSALDFGAVLEGENTLTELCQGVDPTRIAGLLRREEGGVAYTGDRPFIADLDAVPFPTYRHFALQQYATDEIPLLTSRGCPYACIFCAAKAAAGRRFKARSACHVADEIQYWYQRGRRHFAVIDDNFTLKKDRVLQLCGEIERRGLAGLELRCPNGVRADRVDEHLLIRMKQVGFRYLAFGVESGSDRILKGIRKGERLEAIRRSTRLACDLGYEVALFFIVGFPGETWSDIEESLEFARSFPVVDAKFFNLLPVPGTELFRWASENQRFTTPPEQYLNDAAHWQNDARWDPVPVFDTPELPLRERAMALAHVARSQREIHRRAQARLKGA